MSNTYGIFQLSGLFIGALVVLAILTWGVTMWLYHRDCLAVGAVIHLFSYSLVMFLSINWWGGLDWTRLDGATVTLGAIGTMAAFVIWVLWAGDNLLNRAIK